MSALTCPPGERHVARPAAQMRIIPQKFVCAVLVAVAALWLTSISWAQAARQTAPGTPGKTQADSAADLVGVWGMRVTPAMRSYYLYAFNPTEPPMTAWGEAKFKAAKASFGARAVPVEQTNDPVYQGCFPPGVPRAYLHPFPIQFVNVPGREVIMLYEYDHLVRHIYTDGRPHDTSAGPTWMGDSIGTWDGNTLVVDTIGFNDKTWLDRLGHPHSEDLHVIERMRRMDQGTMQIDMTFEDPKAYTKPWGVQYIYEQKPADWKILELMCEENESFLEIEKKEVGTPAK
jgi:hypothetical protein